MFVKKRINNNVVLAVEKDHEMIVVGKGIGFQVYPNDEVDQTLIQQRYLPSEKMSIQQMALLLENVTLEDIELVESIIKMAEERINKKISSMIMFSLLDHLAFAIERNKKNMNIRSPIEWEVKKFYSREVEIGEKAVEMIREALGIELPVSEAVFIALHFINYQYDQETMDATMDYLEAIGDITQIVRFFFQIDIDEDSINYQRFLNHLRYYLIRQSSGETSKVLDNEELFLTVKEKYHKEYQCVKKISHYLSERYRSGSTSDEKLYLTLHLARLINS